MGTPTMKPSSQGRKAELSCFEKAGAEIARDRTSRVAWCMLEEWVRTRTDQRYEQLAADHDFPELPLAIHACQRAAELLRDNLVAGDWCVESLILPKNDFITRWEPLMPMAQDDAIRTMLWTRLQGELLQTLKKLHVVTKPRTNRPLPLELWLMFGAQLECKSRFEKSDPHALRTLADKSRKKGNIVSNATMKRALAGFKKRAETFTLNPSPLDDLSLALPQAENEITSARSAHAAKPPAVGRVCRLRSVRQAACGVIAGKLLRFCQLQWADEIKRLRKVKQRRRRSSGLVSFTGVLQKIVLGPPEKCLADAIRMGALDVGLVAKALFPLVSPRAPNDDLMAPMSKLPPLTPAAAAMVAAETGPFAKASGRKRAASAQKDQ